MEKNRNASSIDCPKHPLQLLAWIDANNDKKCGICTAIDEEMIIAKELDEKLAKQKEFADLINIKAENQRKKEEIFRLKLLTSGKVAITSSTSI